MASNHDLQAFLAVATYKIEWAIEHIKPAYIKAELAEAKAAIAQAVKLLPRKGDKPCR